MTENQNSYRERQATLWEGREIPRDAGIFCATDYGGSKGVYLDVYLKWYISDAAVASSSITSKTLCRMTGGILEFMDAVEHSPLRISAYDKAVLAVRDGNRIRV